MWIKPAIAILFVLLVISLVTGGAFLFKDQGAPDKRRTLWALGLRVSLAALLLGILTYGVLSGQIRSQAPWSQPKPQPVAPVTEANPE